MDHRSGDLFRHVSADKAAFYRTILDVFAAAKRQFRPYLRPDEVLREATWPADPPTLEEVRVALAQLVEWGNLEAQPDTARVASLNDYYLARFLYRLSHGGEAVESALAAFTQALKRRGELQSVALEDIHHRLDALIALGQEPAPDEAKVHEVLRDLVRVFEDLAENAQAFMTGIARSVDIQQADANAVIGFKKRLIDYLERFIGDLVSRSGAIARRIEALAPRIDAMLWQTANREVRDAAPADVHEQADALQARVTAWRERWRGLRLWFVSDGHGPPQAEALRAKARAAIPRLLAAIATVEDAATSGDPAAFREVSLGDLPMGASVIGPDGTTALLYTTVDATEALLRLDLATGATRPVLLQKTVRAVAFGPLATRALVLHRTSGAAPSPNLPLDQLVDASEGYSVVDVVGGVARLELTDHTPGSFTFTPGGERLYLLLPDPAGLAHAVADIHLTTLMGVHRPLASPPETVQPVPAAGKVAVSQAHPTGRLTFFDVATGDSDTLTGFQLGGLID